MRASLNVPHYEIEQRLGHNATAGRTTYQARSLDNDQKVVLKAFEFFHQNSSWTEKQRYKREITMLRSLNHPGIPQYIESFEHDGILYLVQEYIAADNLASHYGLRPADIKIIAERLLEITQYLQEFVNPVVHGDIKPENILLRFTQDGIELFLVDFGLSRTSSNKPSSDSAGIGTFGFIPPEKLQRQLSRASDLYGIGATIICLLCGKTTEEIHTLTLPDEPHRFEFREYLNSIDSDISPQFINWLERMVEPSLGNRYPDATTALAALRPLKVIAKARPGLSCSQIQLSINPLGEPLQCYVRVYNMMPDTALEGRWYISPLPYDKVDWITLSPQNFASNDNILTITITPNLLKAGQNYNRSLVLESNGENPIIMIPVSIQTSTLQPQYRRIPVTLLIKLLAMGMLFPIIVFWLL